MRIFAGFFACLLIAYSCFEADADCYDNYDGTRSEKTFKTDYKVTDQCVEYTCNPNGEWSQRGCFEWTCKRRTLGYATVDFSKPFPCCCGYPICE